MRGAESWRLYTVRMTVQATHKDTINVHWDEQHACNGATFTTTQDGCRQQPENGNRIGPLGLGGLSSTTSPEIGAYLDAHPRVRQVTWSETATNKMLFEAGFGAYQAPFGPYESPGNTTRSLVRMTEQCSAGCSLNGGLPGVTYRSANWSDSWDAQYTWRASMSYVTGAHTFKVGYGGVALVSDLQGFTNDNNLSYTVNNGTAISLTQTLLPFTTSYRTRNMSLYAQDQWTRGRMTLQDALRLDRNSSFSPEERINASNWLATALVFPKTDGVNAYKDISPRGGVAYDLFGNGKTAVKFGEYLEPTSNNNNYTLSNPITRIATTATRRWTDANSNWIPDCDLRNQGLQDLRASGGDGILLNVSARLGRGVQFQGGINSGKTVQDNCAVRAQIPELTTVAGVSPAVNVGNPYCHSDPGVITKATALGSYTIPRVDVAVSGTLRSDQGGILGATWNAPSALVASALGRPVAGNPATVAIALVKPGDVRGDRVNAIDVRFAKMLRFGRVRYNVGVDIINLTNSDAVLTYNQNYNPNPATAAQRWLAPSSVLTPRFVKLGAQIDF